MSDNLIRWWLNWYEIIHTDECTSDFGVGGCMLFASHRLPKFDSSELWTDIIPLCNLDCQNLFYLNPVLILLNQNNILHGLYWKFYLFYIHQCALYLRFYYSLSPLIMLKRVS